MHTPKGMRRKQNGAGDRKEDGKISEAITRYIVALYWQSPLLHFESSAFAFFSK